MYATSVGGAVQDKTVKYIILKCTSQYYSVPDWSSAKHKNFEVNEGQNMKWEEQSSKCCLTVLLGKVISVGVDLSEVILKEASIFVSKCEEDKYFQSTEGFLCQATTQRSKEFSAIYIPFHLWIFKCFASFRSKYCQMWNIFDYQWIH